MIKNVKHIFGKNAWAIPKIKIKPANGSGRIPDFYVLDTISKKLYVVEVERSSHSIPDHITPQITGFYRILSDISSRDDLLDKLYDRVMGNTDLKREFKDNGIDEIHKFLKDTINKSYEVVLIIDNITEELKNALSYGNPHPEILEFRRYKKAGGDVFIYEMDSLDKDFAKTDSILVDNIDEHLSVSSRSNITSMIPDGYHIYMKYRGKTYVATIESGRIRMEDDSIEPTLFTATKKITGWKSANVWKLWFLDRECTKSIDRLRQGK